MSSLDDKINKINSDKEKVAKTFFLPFTGNT